ncbi:hypothetical protein [Microbispora triticiradicis]|uniref:DUF2029 domain-containing protein n=2 Tax=Microbispora TaxID=2005 RepID=A0ABY3M166_9ACTN|nr:MULTISPECIES: hypothetical protein [Microbispora]TLP59708.1 hypothetical protein FED44_15625 [Microbispora fusca]TYB63422.1 hypothetical protein FXF59_08785 [Microbispora tritici]
MNGLERRYRRLLAWYPRDHRVVHEEEMIGVLLAGADSGCSRPGPWESADLLLGALRLHARRAVRRVSGSPWQDALAVAGVVGALLVLLRPLTRLAYGLVMSPPQAPEVLLPLVTTVTPVLPAAVALGAAAMNVRMVAAAASWWAAATIAWNWATIQVPYSGAHALTAWPWSDSSLYLAVAAAVALTLSRTPRTALVLLGARRVVAWSLMAVVVLLPVWSSAAPVPPVVSVIVSGVLSDGGSLLVLAVIAAGLALRRPAGRRAVAVLAIPFVVQLTWSTSTTASANGWLTALLKVLALTAILAILGRRAARPAGDGADPLAREA